MKTAIQQAIEMQKEHLKVFKVSLSLEKVGSIEYLKLLGLITYLESSIEYHLPTLLPTERQIIEDAWADGYNECDFGDELGSAFSSPTDYYNKTFNNQTDKNGTAMTANHTANGRNYLIVQVPESNKYNIVENTLQCLIQHLIWCDKQSGLRHEEYEVITSIKLPSGQYRIMFVAEEATPEQAAEVVETVNYDIPPSAYNDFQGDWDTGYIDYECEEQAPNAEFPYVRKAIDSLASMIRSKFTDHYQHKHLIIEKID